MLVRRLQRAGHQVTTAGDGEAALGMMREGAPRGRTHGYEFAHHGRLDRLRRGAECRRQRRDIPIIALTAHAMEEDKQRALEAGCSDFATKPVDFPDLLKIIGAPQCEPSDAVTQASTAAQPARAPLSVLGRHPHSICHQCRHIAVG